MAKGNQGNRTYELKITNLKTGLQYTINALRVKFSGSRGTKSTSSKGKIEVYNIAKSTRETFNVASNKDSTPNLMVELSVGYDGENSLLMKGQAICFNVWRKPHIATVFEVSDGAFEQAVATANLKYVKGDSLNTVIKDLMDIVGLPKGEVFTVNKTLTEDTAFKGRAPKILDRLGSENGFRYIVENSVQSTVDINSTQTSVFSLSAETGLINIPYQKGNFLMAQCLLNPQIRINKYVEVKPFADILLEGVYRCLELKFKGDTHGNAWDMNLTLSLKDKVSTFKEVIDDINTGVVYNV